MQIENLEVDKIIPYINNAKKHPQEQINQIKASITAFGFNDPIAIDENNVIIEGHGRLLAAEQLAMKEVPVIKLTHLNETQKKQYILAHNKLTMNSEFDEDMLKLELEAIKLLDGEIDITGFDTKELENMDFEVDNEIEEDEAPEANETKEPYSKQGDLWLLGKHRLLCGDSVNEENVETLMNGNKAEMVFTDPPYLMGFTGNVSGGGVKSFNTKYGEIKNDKMSKEDGKKFIDKIFLIIKENVVGAYYVCFYRLGLNYIYSALDTNMLEHKALIIWSKGNHTLSGSDYMSKYEPIIYGYIKEHNFYGDRKNYDIWEITRTQKNDLHPTMKPLELVKKAVANSSKHNDIILDLFGGSGSSLIVSEQLNRICYMMELDEKYVDVIVKRYSNLGKDDIKLIRNGETYEWKDIKGNFAD